MVGEVDAIGPGVSGFQRGQPGLRPDRLRRLGRVLVRDATDFLPVPDGLDDGEVIALILNYVTARQMIHRTAEMKPGQLGLVTGANGGVGVALLELLRIHGARAIAAASPAALTSSRAKVASRSSRASGRWISRYALHPRCGRGLRWSAAKS